MLQPQRLRTVFLTISVFRITSLLEWTVTKFKSVQIFCSRNYNELCYTFNACFLDDFVLHSTVEYQCSSPCKYMNGSFLFLHMQSIWTMFGTNNNSDKVSKWEYMESHKRMNMNIHDWLWIFNTLLRIPITQWWMLIPLSRWSWIFICHSEMPVNTWETTANGHGYSWLFMDVHKSVIDIP